MSKDNINHSNNNYENRHVNIDSISPSNNTHDSFENIQINFGSISYSNARIKLKFCSWIFCCKKVKEKKKIIEKCKNIFKVETVLKKFLEMKLIKRCLVTNKTITPEDDLKIKNIVNYSLYYDVVNFSDENESVRRNNLNYET
jgi:hypothetical protein